METTELKINLLKREFDFDGMTLPDPNPNFTVKRVQAFYANQYPPIMNAVVTKETTANNKIVYKLEKNPGLHG